MMVANPHNQEIMYVCRNMRASSREEIEAASDMSLDTYGRYLCHTGGMRWAFYHNGVPCAVLGATEMHKGVFALYGFGTDDWKSVWRLVTLVAKRDMTDALIGAGAHRGQCLSPASHVETHKWLRFIGLTHEADMPAYGKNGEDYLMFSILFDQVKGR